MTYNVLLRKVKQAAIALLAAFMLASLSSCVTSRPYYAPGYEYYYNGRYHKTPQPQKHNKHNKHKKKPPKPHKPPKSHKQQKVHKPNTPNGDSGHGHNYRGSGEHR